MPLHAGHRDQEVLIAAAIYGQLLDALTFQG